MISGSRKPDGDGKDQQYGPHVSPPPALQMPDFSDSLWPQIGFCHRITELLFSEVAHKFEHLCLSTRFKQE